MALMLVLARLSELSSELHIAEDRYRKTAPEDLSGLGIDEVNEDRLAAILDSTRALARAAVRPKVRRMR